MSKRDKQEIARLRLKKMPRNWRAVDAHFRKAGAMKDRREPRGGARNESRELVTEYRKVREDEECE